MNYKSLEDSVDKPHYDRAYQLLNTARGKAKCGCGVQRQSRSVGTLLNFRRLKKVYTKGNDLAVKQVLMAAAAYNLKKFMRFKTLKTAANVMKNTAAELKETLLNVLNRTGSLFERILFDLNFSYNQKS
jgi:hypothetical protein